MVPQPQPKREGKIVDYLANKRKERGNSVDVGRRNIEWESLATDTILDDETKIEKAYLLELEAKKHERNIKSVNSKDKTSLTIADETDTLLLNSIRAKLAILNTNNP